MPFHGGRGWWVVFPVMAVVMIVAMLVMMTVFRGSFGPWWSRPHEHERDHDGDDDALEILRRRFARGEITEEEFKRQRELLRR